MVSNKPRVIQDFEKLPKEIQEQIKLTYPSGFSQSLIQFTGRDGRLISALPFETDEKYYLVRMTMEEADELVYSDDDYDDDGFLKESSKENYEDKYAELEYMSDVIDNNNDIADETDDSTELGDEADNDDELDDDDVDDDDDDDEDDDDDFDDDDDDFDDEDDDDFEDDFDDEDDDDEVDESGLEI